MLEKLSVQGMHERLRDWHAGYFLSVVEEAEIGLRGPQQLLWLERLVADRDNIRAALEWSLQQAKAKAMINASAYSEQGSIEDARHAVMTEMFSSKAVSGKELPAIELCLRLASALRPYWEWQGYLVEGRSWLGAALAIPLEEGAGKATLAARAKALSEASRLECLQNEQTRAVELAEESIALWRRLDSPSGLATALLHKGWAALAMDGHGLAKSLFEQGLQLLSPTGDTWLRGQLLLYLAAAAGFNSDYEQMRSFYTQSREMFEQVGDKISVADLLKDQGGITIIEGKYSQAIEYLLKSIKLCYELGHRQFVATGLGSLSFAVGLRGEPEQGLASIHSAQLGGAAEGLMDTIGLTPWTKTYPLAQMARQMIRSRVDEGSWNEAWAEGRALTAEQAIDLANRLA
jgi:tetratricopeptide (TPR) repeat protein